MREYNEFYICKKKTDINTAEVCSSIILGLIDYKLVFNTCTRAYFPVLCIIKQFKASSFQKSLHYLGAFLLIIVLGVNRVKNGDLMHTSDKSITTIMVEFCLDFFMYDSAILDCWYAVLLLMCILS